MAVRALFNRHTEHLRKEPQRHGPGSDGEIDPRWDEQQHQQRDSHGVPAGQGDGEKIPP